MSIELLTTDLEKVSYLCNLLTAHATGETADNKDYEELRYEILSNQSLASYMPQWVKLHRNLGSFWGFIKPKYGTYAERRTFIAEEFAPILNYLEFGESPTPETIPAQEESLEPEVISTSEQENTTSDVDIKNKVFIVHGRDNEAKQEVSRFVESLGLEAIILHEQASGGMTIIEKIEHYANNADFAIVLYTPCDHGRGVHETKVHPRNRARQNVVFEHGYLMAKLGRENVCALVKGDIETPNDISGVVYVSLDTAGAWKIDVVRELNACGYSVSMVF